MNKDIVKSELEKLLNEDLDKIIVTGNKPSAISSNKKFFNELKQRYPNILIRAKYLIEICKNKDSFEKCFGLYFCECGNEKTLNSKFCSNHNCPAKNKSVAKNCFLTKLKNHGDGKYNNSKKNAETCMKRYGVKNVFQSVDPKLNGKQTKLEKYGSETYTNRDKAKQTCLKKYGKENYMSTDEFRNKSKEYFQEHYGKDYFYETEEFQDKRRESCLNKYGQNSFSKTEEFKKKSKKTWLENFGVDHPMKSKQVKDKLKTTMIEHWGNYFTKTKYFKDLFINKEFVNNMKNKEYETKRQNDSFNVSKPEDRIYKLLLAKFKDIKHLYKDNKYPFLCDFYIPSKSLYIELNFHWTHGNEPFNKDNKKHLEILTNWKSKNSKFYNNAIYVWTDLDVRKLKTFKDNKLNYKIFYNENQFDEWFKEQ